MESMNKKLSVAMPNYNDAASVSMALKAMCEQSVPPDEIVIVDDASTDNSVEVIKELAVQYPYIKLVCNEKNRGVIFSVNKAISLTNSDYLYLASSNDFILPGFFEKSLQLLAEYPKAGLSYTDSREYHLSDGHSFDYRWKWLEEAGYLSPTQLAETTRILGAPCMGAPNTIFRREFLPSPVYIPELESWADWFVCQTMAFRYGCCYIPEVLAVVTVAENSHSSSDRKNFSRYKQACSKLFQLLMSPEYENVCPQFMRSRALFNMNKMGKNPLLVYRTFLGTADRNQYAHSMVSHMFGHFVACGFGLIPVNEFLYGCRLTKSAIDRMIVQPVQDASITIGHFFKNIWDRTYAHSFQSYDRVRSIIKNR